MLRTLLAAVLTSLPVALLAGAAAAQATTTPHIVLTRLAGAPASLLAEVDPVTGAVQPLPAFASHGLPPLAVAIDPFDGDLLVALDAGGGSSLIVRLVRVAGAFAELPIAVLPGRVVDLAVLGDDLFAASDAPGGGVYRMPRRGGAPALALPQDNLTAMQALPGWSTAIAVAWTGRPGTAVVDSGTGVFDVANGSFALGPDSFPNPNGLETTGLVDLPTAIPRQLLSFADGSFALFAPFIAPALQPVTTSVGIPPGGAAAMHTEGPYSVQPLALGGAPLPFLYAVDAFSGAVTLRSQALPGAPVDFATGLDVASHSEAFGGACGPVALALSWSGAPQPAASVTTDVAGPPNEPVLLAGGLDDFAFGALPAALPGGCLVEVLPEVVLLHLTGPSGAASNTLAIPPATPIGTTVFLQWVHFGAAGFSTSAAVVHRVGP